MFKATKQSDHSCLYAIRMSMRVFEKLCTVLVPEGGLKKTNNVEVEEVVVMFLHTSHNIKNRIVQQHFGRSGKAICAVIHAVLVSILNMYDTLYRKVEPVSESSGHAFWKYFKVCSIKLSYKTISFPYNS
ncbi:hypothetical protein LINGRAHAP2_LOCUS1850 [Linum grandiflorum]